MKTYRFFKTPITMEPPMVKVGMFKKVVDPRHKTTEEILTLAEEHGWGMTTHSPHNTLFLFVEEHPSNLNLISSIPRIWSTFLIPERFLSLIEHQERLGISDVSLHVSFKKEEVKKEILPVVKEAVNQRHMHLLQTLLEGIEYKEQGWIKSLSFTYKNQHIEVFAKTMTITNPQPFESWIRDEVVWRLF
ncbi:hypothetical protein ACFYKX_11000 [Cytobacillus sp. FJAT-54145]|uniref:Uncharacterized protein n=1 Tax=Cytobacillus spartinae TaxID=3299023 RepID=A0ABW6KA69_9BACI